MTNLSVTVAGIECNIAQLEPITRDGLKGQYGTIGNQGGHAAPLYPYPYHMAFSQEVGDTVR